MAIAVQFEHNNNFYFSKRLTPSCTERNIRKVAVPM